MRLFVLYFLSQISAQEFFSSHEALKRLEIKESFMLKEFQAGLEKKLEEVSSLLSDLSEIKDDRGENIDHPLDQFKLIRRFQVEWPDLLKVFQEEFGIELPDMDDTPSNDDLKGSIDAIFRLQNVYKLDALDLALGLDLGTQALTIPVLNADECLLIAKNAYWDENFYYAAVWCEAAWKLVQNGDQSADSVEILDYFSIAISRLGDQEQARDMTLQLIELAPSEERYRRNLEYYTNDLAIPMVSKINNNFTTAHLSRPYDDREWRKKYESLCRGEGTEIPKHLVSQMKCWYHHGRGDSSLLIAPIRTEMLYPEPLVVQFFDVLSDLEATAIQKLANRQLNRATIRDPASGKLTTANYRIQKTAWLKEGEAADTTDVVSRYNKRISDITGLSTETAELLQLGNYGIGGQYEPHWDHQSYPGAQSSWDENQGSRIATWLTYMSQPNMGGGTIFLDLEIQAQPIKNSAVFWYNHLPSGESDDATNHAACPVLSGTKWVSNKWFHIRGQEFSGRPCALDPAQKNNYL